MMEEEITAGGPDFISGQYDIPVDGSLGLLALGATGIKIWRSARRAAHASDIETENRAGDAEA